MSFAVGDKVVWADNHDDRGEVIEVQGPDKHRSRNPGNWRVRVRWYSHAIGWTSPHGIRHLDAVTRLGDIARGRTDLRR